jgi:NAD(P)H-hydrate epimerase
LSTILSLEKVINYLAVRAPDSHKTDFGHLMILAGDRGMSGAAILSAQAAARVGAGLVTILTHPEHSPYISLAQPEVMCYGLNQPEQVQAALEKATALVLGPGLTNNAWSQSMLEAALISSLPMIIDAGAFYTIRANKQSRANWIITPHPGEAARLLDCSIAEVQANRIQAVHNLQRTYGGVALLKGHRSLISCQNQLYECPYGNPGMASGGMGDLLSGILGGLLAQGLDLEQAACLGACLHAKAGDYCAQEYGERGIIASDLLNYLPKLLNSNIHKG